MRRSHYLVFILLLICQTSFGQIYQNMAQPGYKFSRARFDSVLTIPTGLGNLKNISGGQDTGQIRFNKSDSSVYVWNGRAWIKAGGGTIPTLTQVLESAAGANEAGANQIKDLSAGTSQNDAATFGQLTDTANLRLRISDTAAMLANYAKTAAVALKLNISDTATMLAPYSRVTVTSYGKNAGGDSTILLLSNGTRYAAKDSVGGGGGAGSVYAGAGLQKQNDSTLRVPLLESYRPEDYGAIGDSITNDAAAFTAMIADMPARGGKVILSSKTYLINSTVTVNKPIWFEGTGMGDSSFPTKPTAIISKTANIVVFDITENQTKFSNLSFKNMQSTNPTAGTALRFLNNARTSSYIFGFYLEKVNFNGYYDNVQATNALEWTIESCRFVAPVRYSLYVACPSLPDGGDSHVRGNSFWARVGGSTAAIYQESSGGLKIIDNKFNSLPGNAGKYRFFVLTNIIASTVDLLINANSMENYSETAIKVYKSGGTFRNVIINNNQFAGFGSTRPDVILEGIGDVSVVGNIFLKSLCDTALSIANASDAVIYNSYTNYGTPTFLTGSSNVNISKFRIAMDNSLGSNLVTPAEISATSLSTTVPNTVKLTAGTSSGFLRVYPQSFSVTSLASKTAFGPDASNGLVMFTNGNVTSGGTGTFSLRAGGYETAAEKIYADRFGVGFGTQSVSGQITIGPSTASAGSGQIKFITGTSQTTKENGVLNYVGSRLLFTNGSLAEQEIPLIQQVRVATQYDNATTTLGNVTGLAVTAVPGRRYRFEAKLYTTSNVAGGIKVAIGGTCTATTIIYEGLTTDGGVTTQGRGTALGTAVGGVTAVTAAYVEISGTILVNTLGTLTVQAAANSAVGTTSVLVGSTFVVTEIL